MSSGHESKSLIRINLDSLMDPNKKSDLSNLSHLERLSALVFVFMQARSKFDDQGHQWFTDSREQNIELDALLETYISDKLWPISTTQSLSELPKVMSEKIEEMGNPFGFSKDETRAALEMAHELSSNQMHVDGIRMNIISNNELDPIAYFQETMFQMYHFGHTVGPNIFTPSTFPANNLWNELFPPEVGRQIESLENSLRTRKLE